MPRRDVYKRQEYGWRYGYPYVIGLMALSVLLPVIWFKRRGWW